jgi:hypothetical protein
MPIPLKPRDPTTDKEDQKIDSFHRPAPLKPTDPTTDKDYQRIDPFRQPEIDIYPPGDSIAEADGTFMQAPDPWPDPPKDEE